MGIRYFHRISGKHYSLARLCGVYWRLLECQAENPSLFTDKEIDGRIENMIGDMEFYISFNFRIKKHLAETIETANSYLKMILELRKVNENRS